MRDDEWIELSNHVDHVFDRSCKPFWEPVPGFGGSLCRLVGDPRYHAGPPPDDLVRCVLATSFEIKNASAYAALVNATGVSQRWLREHGYPTLKELQRKIRMGETSMKACGVECAERPCCDFCVFMPHPKLPDGRADLDHPWNGGGPCQNPKSPHFNQMMDWGSSGCDEFVCFNTVSCKDSRDTVR